MCLIAKSTLTPYVVVSIPAYVLAILDITLAQLSALLHGALMQLVHSIMPPDMNLFWTHIVAGI